MKMFRLSCLGATAALLLNAVGCYSYKAPASATLGNSYTERQHDASDDLFKGMTTLTLLDAQRIAIRNNPTYIAAYHSVEAARMKYLQAWGAYSPTINAGFTGQDQRVWELNYRNVPYYGVTSNNPHADAFTTSTTLSANFLVFDGFARYFRLKASESNFNYYARMEEDACRTMMYSVAYAYNSVLLAIENRRISMENRKFQMDSLQNTQYKFEAGAAPLSDVLNFEIQVKSADVAMISADYQYEVAIYALAQLMGYPDGMLPPELKFPGDYKTSFVELPAIEIYLDAALANRPDLKAYREQLNIAKYQVYQAWGAYSPTVNAFLNWGYGTNAAIHSGFNPERSRDYYESMSLAYGITADWTVFNGAIRYNQLREAQAFRAVADFQVAAQWFKVVSEVRTAYANYIQSVKKTREYAQIRNLSAKQRDLVDDEYRAGNVELTRLNEAQRDLVDAETNLASSYINVQNARAQLDSVVGGNTADYFLKTDGNEKYPGLGGVSNAISKAEAAGVKNIKQTAPVSAPDPVRQVIPGTPAQSSALPAPEPGKGTSAQKAVEASTGVKSSAATPAPAVKQPAAFSDIPASPTAPPKTVK